MKNLHILILLAAPLISHGMDSSLHDSLQWLGKNTDYTAPEVVERITKSWHQGMSFLARYEKANFNEADIYENEVFFNECQYSNHIYQMTYDQVEAYLNAVGQIPDSLNLSKGDPLGYQYMKIIISWKKFDRENQAYRNAWRNREWRTLRNIVKAKQVSS